MAGKTLDATALRQLLWIACGVVVLTVLVIFVSWLFPGSSTTAPANQPVPITTTETGARQAFQPESPSPGFNRGLPSAVAPANEPQSTDIPKAKPPEDDGARPAQENRAAEQPEESPRGSVPATVPEPATSAPNQKVGAEAPKPAQPSQAAAQGFGVQLGAFSEAANVKDLETRLRAQGYRVVLAPKGKVTRVIVAGPKNRAEAEALRDALKKKGFPQASVVTLP